MNIQARTSIYCRISRDIAETTLGVQRQEKLCRDLVATRGWSVAGVYVDNDVSATDKRKRRPEYVRMLEDLAGGRFDVIVALGPAAPPAARTREPARTL